MSVPQQDFSNHNNTIRDKQRALTDESGASERMRLEHMKHEREHREKEIAKADLTQKKRIFDQNKIEMERLEFEIRRIQGEISQTEAQAEQFNRVFHIAESQAIVGKHDITLAANRIKKLEDELQSSRRESTIETGRAVGGTPIEKKSTHERKKAEIERLKIQVRKLQEEITHHEMEEKQMAAGLIELEKHSVAHTQHMAEVGNKIHKLEAQLMQEKNSLSKLQIFFEHTMAEKIYKEKMMVAKKTALVDLKAKKIRDFEAIQHLKQENSLISHQIQLLDQKAK